MNNIILKTDSYKIGGHWNMYPEGTEHVYSYFESRKGAQYPFTVFFGIQPFLKSIEGRVITQENIEDAAALCQGHFGNTTAFNSKGWQYIVDKHDGKLPLRIKAVPEGTVVPTSNILASIENTDKECAWLTNYIESYFIHIWYPSTVATQSRACKLMLSKFLFDTSDNQECVSFMLHDFGYRGVSSDESADIGGAAHLINFFGTDTIEALSFINKHYDGKWFNHKWGSYGGIGYSVPATEHSIMSALGPEGEEKIVSDILYKYPSGILSVVGDTYDIYNFCDNIVGKTFKEKILARNGVFVIRPDSITPTHPFPETEMVWILESLWHSFGGIVNSKGFKVLNPKIRALWGDGLDMEDILQILKAVKEAGFSIENVVFGMGGGLLQKINRDTQRFAFKSSAQCRNGVWYDIYKKPKDESKVSKKGKLKLVQDGITFLTVPESDPRPDVLKVVFENGVVNRYYSFEDVRSNALVTPLEVQNYQLPTYNNNLT